MSMAIRAMKCAACGHPYAARINGGDVIVSTTDGKCACGSEEFVEV